MEVGVGRGRFSAAEGTRVRTHGTMEQRQTQVPAPWTTCPGCGFQGDTGFLGSDTWKLGDTAHPVVPGTVSIDHFLLLQGFARVVFKTKHSFPFWPLFYIPYSFIFNKQFQIPYFIPPTAYK